MKTVSTLRKTAGKVSFLTGLAVITAIVALEILSQTTQGTGSILSPFSPSMSGHPIVQTILAISGMGLILVSFKLRESVTASLLSEAEALGASLEARNEAFTELERSIRERSTELTRVNHDLNVYKSVIEETSEGIILTDIFGTIEEVNNAFLKMTGFEREDLIGRNPRIMKSNRHDNGFFKDMWHAILNQGRWEGEVWDRKKDGSIYPKWLSIDTIRDEQG
ncbi:MAG: PAS domain-containing protein, partial [Spirochaetota bacterium]